MAVSYKGRRVKGVAWERNCKEFLQKLGHFVVIQSASIFPDLITISPEGIASFIECKSKLAYLRKNEREQLKRLSTKYKVAAYIMYPRTGVYSKRADNFVARRIA